MKKNLKFISLCFFTWVILFSTFVVAQSSERFVDEYDNIDKFAQRLLKSPFDQEARIYFEQLAASDSEVFKVERMKLLRIKELLVYIEFLHKQVGDLSDKNVTAIQEISSRYKGTKTVTLTHLIEFLSDFRKVLVRQFDQIRSSSIAKSKDQNKVKLKSEPPATAVNDIKTLRVELSALHRRFDELTKRINLADQKAQKLTEDLTAKTLELFEKDEIIERQKQNLMTLEQKLDDIQERFTLSQRLIQEKNNQLQQLEVGQTKKETRRQEKGDQLTLEGLQAQIKQLQDQLNEQISSSKSRMSVLERLLMEQEKRMAEYAIELKSKGEKVDQLTGLVFEKSKEISGLNAVLQSKDQKLLELDGIIEIYKGKLSESNRILREKVDQIKVLENQLVETHNRIYNSKFDLKEIANQVSTLKNKLYDLP